MSNRRANLIRRIEAVRKSKVITYVMCNRANIALKHKAMNRDDVRELKEHVEDANAIDLIIVSNGGESGTPWMLVNLIREYAKKFSVLVPYNAYSASTSVALGADEIIMCPESHLGPVDSSLLSPLNPRGYDGRPVEVNEEDVSHYGELAESIFGIRGKDSKIKVFELLSQSVHPLILGASYRMWMKAREDVRKMLELHMDKKRDKKKIYGIIDAMVVTFYYHGHPINRTEGRGIGLNILNAENFSKGGDKLDKLLWELYKSYESDLKFNEPYLEYNLPKNHKQRIVTKSIESRGLVSEYVINQQFIPYTLLSGEQFTLIPAEGLIGRVRATGQIIPILSEAEIIVSNKTLFEKKEKWGWERVRRE